MNAVNAVFVIYFAVYICSFLLIVCMGWKIKLHRDFNIIETTFDGDMQKEELGNAVTASIQAVLENKSARLLADCTGLTGGHSLFDLYENAGNIPVTFMQKEFREAVLMPTSAGARGNVEFWETVTTNLGFKVKIFENRDKALEWLTE